MENVNIPRPRENFELRASRVPVAEDDARPTAPLPLFTFRNFSHTFDCWKIFKLFSYYLEEFLFQFKFNLFRNFVFDIRFFRVEFGVWLEIFWELLDSFLSLSDLFFGLKCSVDDCIDHVLIFGY